MWPRWYVCSLAIGHVIFIFLSNGLLKSGEKHFTLCMQCGNLDFRNELCSCYMSCKNWTTAHPLLYEDQNACHAFVLSNIYSSCLRNVADGQRRAIRPLLRA